MHTLNEIMAVAPALDNTNGATSTHVLSGTTYWGLRTDGGWGPQTGTRAPALVATTGQMATFATGDDGDSEKGEAWPNPRFMVLSLDYFIPSILTNSFGLFCG